jgi:hypothetical protein
VCHRDVGQHGVRVAARGGRRNQCQCRGRSTGDRAAAIRHH